MASASHFRQPPSADDWQPGDLAECINSAGWFQAGIKPSSGPIYGEAYRVADVTLGRCQCCADNPERPFLAFSAFGREFFDAAGFRKITPRADALERAEPDFLTRLLPDKEAARCLS